MLTVDVWRRVAAAEDEFVLLKEGEELKSWIEVLTLANLKVSTGFGKYYSNFAQKVREERLCNWSESTRALTVRFENNLLQL